MKVLIFGGTGAMGKPLTEYLSKNTENAVYVVSRKAVQFHRDNVHCVQGDASNYKFFAETVGRGFDVIVDFMIWEPKDLKERLDVIFSNCEQYIATGTSSEYADNGEIITENTPRLYDKYSDKERKQIHRYHIKKSVDDDIIINSTYHHWTIVRPWVTFNTRKCVCAIVPVSVWLWRYKNDRTVFLPQLIMDRKCTFTYGGDVARAISKLIGNPKALGEVVNIASDKSSTWAQVVDTFQEVLTELGGKPMKISLLSDASVIWRNIPSQYDPLVRDRYYNREFSMAKLNKICGEKIVFGDLRDNLRICFDQMLNDPNDTIEPPSPDYNALMDRLAHENTPLDVYPDEKQRNMYLRFRSGIRARLWEIRRYLKDDRFHYIYKKP